MRPDARALALSVLLAGCAHSGFASSFPIGGSRLTTTVTTAKRAMRPDSESGAIIVGVSGDKQREVFAYDLRARRMLFREHTSAVCMPVIAGEYVVIEEPDRIALRRLRDGVLERSLPPRGMRLVGADGDTTLSAIALSTGGALAPKSRIVLLARNEVSADLPFDQQVGRPAVLGGFAFVPHQRVLLSVLDPEGHERARARIRHDVAGYAFTKADDVYFGQAGMYLVDEALARSEGEKPTYLALELKDKLPGNPPLMPDVDTPAPPVDSALHHVTLSGLPARTGTGLALEDDALYLAFYRILMSITPDAGRAHWAHRSSSDIVGVRSVPGGVLAVEESGRFVALDAEGRLAFEADLGLHPLAASIQAARFDFTGASGEAKSIAASLRDAMADPDTRLVPAQAYAAMLLGHVEDDEAARTLIEHCSQAASAPRLGEAACQALASRPWPSEAVRDALARHADFLAEAPAPPVAALADASLASNDAHAVPLLLAQLADPATPTDALPSVLRALGTLGNASTAAALADFVRLYHAEPAEIDLEEALSAAMEALGKLDPKRARGALEPVALDARARVGVRSAAQNVLSALTADAEKEAADESKKEETALAEEEPDKPAKELPAQLRSEHIETALEGMRPDLSRCVRDAPEKPATARLVIVIGGEGEVLDVKTLPLSIESCAKALVQTATFPATKYGRRSVMTYVVSR